MINETVAYYYEKWLTIKNDLKASLKSKNSSPPAKPKMPYAYSMLTQKGLTEKEQKDIIILTFLYDFFVLNAEQLSEDTLVEHFESLREHQSFAYTFPKIEEVQEEKIKGAHQIGIYGFIYETLFKDGLSGGLKGFERFKRRLDKVHHNFYLFKRNKNETVQDIRTYLTNKYAERSYDYTKFDSFLNFANLRIPSYHPTSYLPSHFEGPITLAEVKRAIRGSQVRGIDNLPLIAYKQLSDTQLQTLVDLFNSFFRKGYIPKTFKQSIVRLIKKDNFFSNDLKSTRAISILNADYKIFTRILTWRLSEYLDLKLDTFQSAFRHVNKKRDVAYNVGILDIIINQLNASEYKDEFDILHMDFKNAYDNVPHGMIIQLAEATKIPGLSKIISALYTDIEMIYEEDLSGGQILPMPQKSGVRLGDPLSNSLFLLIMEVFVRKVKLDNVDNGIAIHPELLKPYQMNIIPYADDFLLVAKNAFEVKQYYNSILDFTQTTGFEINTAKTESLKDNLSFNYLGIEFTSSSGIAYDSYLRDVRSIFAPLIELFPKGTVNYSFYPFMDSLFAKCLNKLSYVLSFVPMERLKSIKKDLLFTFENNFCNAKVDHLSGVLYRLTFKRDSIRRSVQDDYIMHGYIAILRHMYTKFRTYALLGAYAKDIMDPIP